MLKLSPAQKKSWIEDSLAFFAESVDPHTRWIHFCHEDPLVKTTIPVFENTVYLLAQLRDHHIESLQGVIHRFFDLLQFQNSDGSFPCYFHERGYARHSTSIMMILPFSLIWAHYIQLYSEEGKQKVNESFRSLLTYFTSFELGPLDQFCVSVGRWILWNEPLPDLSWPLESFRSLKELTQYFLFMQIVTFAGESTQKKHLSNILQRYWYKGFYVGPLWEERTHEAQIPNHLLDLFEGQQLYEEAPLSLSPLLLPEAVELLPPKLPTSTSWKSSFWHLIESHKAVIHSLNDYMPILSAPLPATFQLLRIAFSKKESLALFQGRFHFSSVWQGSSLLLTVTWSGEEKEGEELSFYITKSPESSWRIDGGLATTFSLSETLAFSLSKHTISIQGEMIEGKGEVLGMISRGGRPSNEKKSFDGSDWVVSIRPQYRTETFVCRLQITLAPNEEWENLGQVPLHASHYQHTKQHP